KKTEIPVVVLKAPRKPIPNFDTIGVAWNHVLDDIQRLENFDYMMISDADCTFPDDYAENMISYMNSNPSIGVASGQVRGELRNNMPMNAGKFIRWKIVESVDHFWDIVPDTFWNIKAVSMGYKLGNRKDIIIEAAPSRGFTTKGRIRYGRLMYYVRRSYILVILQALQFQFLERTGSVFLKGYFSEWLKGTWQCEIPMIKRFYSLPGVILWRLFGFI
ncbi:MAG: hypothetical protein ACTSWQ_10900, partial [Candidatus Thorarchaeota archaeon]